MHLRNVEIFCDVATRRSFSKGAAAHNVSQSSASQAVGALEKRLGVQLIDRSQRPLELTSAGQMFFEGCRDLLDSFRRIEDDVRGMSDRVTGRVRVASIYSVGLLQMDAYVKAYRQAFPDVELQLDYLHPDDVYARVLNDEADIGLVSFPKDGGEIAAISWQEQELGLVLPPDHRLVDREAVVVSELAGEPFVAFTLELKIRRKIDRWLKGERVSVDVVHQFDNVENIKRAVEIGAGVALLPISTVRREVEMGTLAVARLKDVDWSRPLGVVHRRHKRLSVATDKFVELLHEDPATFSVAESAESPTNGHKPPERRKRTGARTRRRAVSKSNH
jgi:DNA-binding transcriptional LysR family regulator